MSERLTNYEAPEHFESMRDFFSYVTFATKEEKQEALRLAEAALLDDPDVYLVDATGSIRKLSEMTEPLPYSRIQSIGSEEGAVYLYVD
ncbi:hypothetical protein [Pseudarthrobacter sp. H2]|uniref:hypothetical protein n=1 Tax=Pseudarthrobacter sp. H2 TaxID=3418415 RepID=UPI003CF51856